MGEALLMEKLPVPIARLPVSSAKVLVGPPLFRSKVSRLISAEDFWVAQAVSPD